jgi:hypothetical protein
MYSGNPNIRTLPVGDGDRDGGAFLAAGGVEVGPAAMESELGAPGGVDRGGWLVGLAAAEIDRERGVAAIVPRRLDQQPPGVA